MRRLLLVLGVVLGSVCLGQGFFPEWERRMLAGEHASAARYAEDLATRYPTSSVWAYRAGASLATAGDGDGAIRWLETCAERGYSGVRTFETDSDLDTVRSRPGFARVYDAVRANAAKRMEAFREAATKAEPRVVLPRGHDASKPTPVVIALHGTGGNGASMARAWRRAAQRAGVILVSPDALRPAGGGYAWTFRDESEWYVEHLIETVKAEHAVSGVILAGFSQGANIALAMGRSHPRLFDAVIPVCGHWESDVAAMPAGPAGDAEDDRPGWFLLIGEEDPWHSTYDEGEAALRDAGMRVEMKKVPGLGHAMPRAGELVDALRWCLGADDP